jgi:uracil-DNA glycosylase
MNNIHESWDEIFKDFNIEIPEPYYPKKEDIFKVFNMSVYDIKIVIFGQDPYIKENQANGLAFSVNNDIKIPPSLVNIFKEIKIEFPERNYNFKHGNLEKWHNNKIPSKTPFQALQLSGIIFFFLKIKKA